MNEKEKTAVSDSSTAIDERQPQSVSTNIIAQPQKDYNVKKANSQKNFDAVDAKSLMEMEFAPLGFAVEKILPQGLFIMAGSGKIGKSWLSLDLCLVVATGGKLWEFNAEQGEVLYLALEDNFQRLQTRLKIMEAENNDLSQLHLVTASLGITSGLIEQVHNFMALHPDTKLIIIDTLERIRDSGYDQNMYSCDYRDMTKLRSITDAHKITVLLIHHTRKMYDPDPLNTLSGSTGLVGSVDGVFVLEKEKRTGNKAKLTIANRDTEGFCFDLDFDSEICKWKYNGISNEIENERNESLCIIVDDWLEEKWIGTATELCELLKKFSSDFNLNPITIKKNLYGNAKKFKNEYGITLDEDRKGEKRFIILSRQNPDDVTV